MIQPDFHFWKRRYSHNEGKPVPEDFEYSSDNNPQKLSLTEMQKIIDNL